MIPELLSWLILHGCVCLTEIIMFIIIVTFNLLLLFFPVYTVNHYKTKAQ